MNIDCIPSIQVPNYKADIGTNVHEIIKEYFRLIGDNPTEKQIRNLAKSCLDHFFDERLADYREDVEKLIENFIKFEISRIQNYTKPILIEQRLEDENFVGIIDYFDGKNIIDWKTGNMTSLSEDEQRQGKTYETLLKNNGYTGSFKIFFATLRNGRTLELPMTTDTWFFNQVNRMFMMIQAGQFPKCKSGLCPWCEVQLACEFDGIELWDLNVTA